MKAAFISDVHIGPSGYYKGVRRKLTEYSEEFINQFVKRVSDSSQYSFAIQLGDLIQDESQAVDAVNFQKGVELFAQCKMQVHHLVGNHDTFFLSPVKVAELLDLKSLFYSFDVEGVHVVLLYSHVPIADAPKILIENEQLCWLRNDLSNSNSPTIVFVHHSLADQDLAGNPWFENRPDHCLIRNRHEVRQILEDSHRVVAVINGHLHWNQVEVHNSIPYITVQSATENFANDGVAANSWGEVELANGKLRLEVFGNDPFRFEYEPKFPIA